MSKSKAAHAVWPAVAVFLMSACTSTKPHTVALHVPPKANKTIPAPDLPEESETDGPDYSSDPAILRRNLPLAGTKWEWDLSQEQSDSSEQVSNYTLEFKPSGWFDFQADCRHGTGIYEIKGPRIALAIIKATHSTCLQGSKAGDYQHALEAAKTFRQAEGKLYLDLKGETETMVFTEKP